MTRNYTVQTKIKRPVADVFDAIVAKEKLMHYFVDGASEDLNEGATVRWRWDHYGENEVKVKNIEPNKRIELVIDAKEWDKTKDDSYDVSVIFEFEELAGGGTLLSISESGWKTDTDGLKASHENCGGWMHMESCLKAWLEHDIDLRQ